MTYRNIERTLTFELLLAFLVFGLQIFRAFQLVQLLGITLGQVVPKKQALFELPGCRRVQVSLNREVIAHGVALDDAAHAADVFRLAVAAAPGDRKPQLAAAERGEIAAGG